MIEYQITVRVCREDLRKLSSEQCSAFMLGVAKVVSANPYEAENVALAERAKEFAAADTQKDE